jgi:NDP-sugar pyrophosphorylase family protein
MSSITSRLPKPLLYLPGGSLLEHQLALLVRLPVSRVHVITRGTDRQIERALAGLNGVIRLAQEPPYTLLGALATASGHIRDTCLVLHGDNYFSHPLDYIAEVAETSMVDSGHEALFVVDHLERPVDRAVRLASAGCYVLSPHLFRISEALRPRDELRSFTKALVDSGVAVSELRLGGWRQNINELGHLLAASARILDDWPGSFHPPGTEAGFEPSGESLSVEQPVWVSPQAEVVDCELGPHAVVGAGAQVRGSVVREAIVFPGARVTHRRMARGIAIAGPGQSLLLATESDVDGGDEGHAEKEVT